jgi:toxin ParE1/3/4
MYSLSKKASIDLDSILDYSIINFGTKAMHKYHKSLENCLISLNKNSDLGVKIEHIRFDYRCFQHQSHLIFYKKKDHNILVIRILHKSMDAQRHIN